MPTNNELGDFTFDTSFFENGIKRMADSMELLPKRAKKFTEQSTRYFQKSFDSTKKEFSGIKKAINTIVGKPLSILKKFGGGAKKIFGGIGKVFGGVKERLSNVKDAGQDMSKSFLKSMTQMAIRVGIFKLALRGIKGIMAQMPEIGQAFGLAKDIFFKNFLYPLRKLVFPYLQRLLDWTRDNRTRFVKWGAVLANIFRTIAFAVKNIIDIGKTLTKSFMGFIERIFGTPVKNLQNLLNLLSFKFAVVLTMLQSLAEPLAKLLEPLIDTIAIGLAGAFETATAFASAFFSAIAGSEVSIKNIFGYIKQIVSSLFEANEQGNSLQTIFRSIGKLTGNIFKFVTNITESFLKGLTPAIKEIMTPLQNIYDSLNNIFKKVFSSEKSLKNWKTIFEFLGKIIGTGLVIYFETIAKAIELINTGLDKLFSFFESDKIKKITENISGIAEFFKSAFTGISQEIFGKKNPKREFVHDAIIQPSGKVIKHFSVKDAIVKKDGKIIQTDPNDTIIATKNKPTISLSKEGQSGSITTNKNSKKIEVKIDFSGMQIILQQGTKEEAQNIGLNIVDTIRQQLAKELEVLGV